MAIIEESSLVKALGMMSGTSLDGVDLCLIETDGEGAVKVLGKHYRAYPPALKARLLEVSRGEIPLNDVLRLERDLTTEYAAAATESGLLAEADVLGCHGQTIRHLPQEGLTWQLGDANRLAERIVQAGRHVPVVMDFRRRDMAAGGEGAPLAPLFHAVMLGNRRPAAVLNIGGVANVTVVMGGGKISASDCGPGMGMLDTWMQGKVNEEFDKDGQAAKRGTPDMALVARALAEVGFFKRDLPRSADRYEFYTVLDWMRGMSVENGAATLCALTVEGIDATLRARGMNGGEVFVSGGGSHNPVIMEGLRAKGWSVDDSSALGWEPLTVEAACFGWLAVRRMKGLTTTLPSTTKCEHPTVGGVLTF